MFHVLNLFNLVTVLCCFITMSSSFVNLSFINIFLQSLIISEKISVQKRLILQYFYLRRFKPTSANCGKAPTRTRSRLPRSALMHRSVSCPVQSLHISNPSNTLNEITSSIDNQAIDVDQSKFGQHE